MFLQKKMAGRRRAALLIAGALLVLAALVWFADKAADHAGKEGLRITQESIARAAVQCYALEGRYPPSMDYLKENYGISPNHELYLIHYQFVASNLAPDITVLHRGK